MDEQEIFLLTQKNPEEEEPTAENLYSIGLVAEIKQVIKMPNDLVRVLVEGIERAELNCFTETEEYLLAEVIRFTEDGLEDIPENAREAMIRCLEEKYEQFCTYNSKNGKEAAKPIQEIHELDRLIDTIANSIPIGYEEKQRILEAVTITERYEVLMAILLREIDIATIRNDLAMKIKSKVEKNQREYILREQLKVIREELGEDNTQSDAEQYEESLKKLKAPKEVKERIQKEIDRFKNISSSSSESAVTRGYIETLLELPWNKASKDNKDLKNAERILDEDHYGLEKVKERMLEFLAVRNLTSKGDSPIICLVGPPGTGKTLLAKAVAGEAGVPFFSISGSDFVEMFVGVGASRVRDLFQDAKKNAPCIIFIDEIDAVARRRGSGLGGGHDEREQTLNQLLVEMDGFGVNEGIIVMAATNRKDILDPAILRPGRFDRNVLVGRPDVGGREEILKVHAKNKPLAEDVDLKQIAQTTAGFTGADLENLLNEAAIIAAKDNRMFIQQKDIRHAFVKVGIGAEKKSRIVSEKERKITAYHEAGHAILFHVLPDVGPVYSVSIIPTGGAGGYTMPLPEKDEMFNTKGQMLQEITVSLGGRVAEEEIFDDITTGASQDIKQATAIAKSMITKFGMSERLGLINYDNDSDEVFIGRDFGHTSRGYGEKIAGTIDEEVKRIIDECYAKARSILEEYHDVLEACAKLLLEKEKITRSEFEALFEDGVSEEG